ncbi:MAG: hypothetical protein LLG04_15305 [Parachlamydia sp.]|nr:hypothetical protein [Parachlamydia sp.]
MKPCPPGGIDPHALQGGQIDLKEQFQRELWEETGISVTEVKGIQPFLLVHDPSKQSAEFVTFSLYLLKFWKI